MLNRSNDIALKMNPRAKLKFTYVGKMAVFSKLKWLNRPELFIKISYRTFSCIHESISELLESNSAYWLC